MSNTDKPIDVAFRALNRFFSCGYLWDEDLWMILNPKPPSITDDECRLLAMEMPLRWRAIRRVFPSPTDYNSVTLH